MCSEASSYKSFSKDYKNKSKEYQLAVKKTIFEYEEKFFKNHNLKNCIVT